MGGPWGLLVGNLGLALLFLSFLGLALVVGALRRGPYLEVQLRGGTRRLLFARGTSLEEAEAFAQRAPAEQRLDIRLR